MLDRVIGASVRSLEIGTDPWQKWSYFQSALTKTADHPGTQSQASPRELRIPIAERSSSGHQLISSSRSVPLRSVPFRPRMRLRKRVFDRRHDRG